MIQAAGNAFYGPGQSFVSFVVEHKEGYTSVSREVPISQELQLEITQTSSYPLHFFFVDANSADNSGSVEIEISGTISTTARLSSIQNCLLDMRSSSIALASVPCALSATGDPAFGWGALPQCCSCILDRHIFERF